MSSRNAVAWTLSVWAMFCCGCTTLVKQTYYTATGAEGKFYELKAVSPSALAEYRAIRMEPFTSSLGDHVPREVIEEINYRTPRTIREEALFNTEGKTLLIRGTIIHYTGRSGSKAALQSLVGSGEQCVCRVELLDAQDGTVLGEAVCWGAVKSALRRGYSEFGEGVARGISKWLEKRLPEHIREQREAERKEHRKRRE